MDERMSMREAAAELRREGVECSTRWLQFLANQGRLPYRQIGRSYAVRLSDARSAVLAARERGPGRKRAA